MNSNIEQQAGDEHPEVDCDDALDNIVWTALCGPHAQWAQIHGDVRRYRPEFAPFAAARNYSETNVKAIAAMLGPGERASLFTLERPQVPTDCETVLEATLIQMIASRPLSSPGDDRIVSLGEADVADIRTLAEIAQPGPFNSRTHQLGNFFGIREDGRLVAMAGERMIARKYVEVSAVSTHPDCRGRGLARTLMAHLTASIQQRDRIPLLHALSTNSAAIDLYRALGYRAARTFCLTVITRSPS
ncbi:GNAT family N-acetyltransferase [Trinickia sp. NRRL B-1857]|uniref:GNAT family N-acetyltransferase n=1 Tax=Trinickia sp. NRRL B-1857 TaxID=3162879 RepID=UPI003D28BB2C